MNKIFGMMCRTSALSLFVLVATQSLAVKPAQALIFESLGGDSRQQFDGPWPVVLAETVVAEALCIAFLPICVLDETQPDSPSALTDQDLLDNGWTKDQIANIRTSQAQSLAILNEQKISASLSPGETRASLAAGLRKLNPAVSPDYIQFMGDEAGLK
jgi:hypothetical protein